MCIYGRAPCRRTDPPLPAPSLTSCAAAFHAQNGAGCKYKHALPPGYKFMTRKQKEAEAALKGKRGGGDCRGGGLADSRVV